MEIQKEERGAIIVEATISLTAYIFAIFTLLTLLDICYIQSKISVALNAAAKEMSQYCYLYYKLDVDRYQSDLHNDTAESREMAENTIEGLGGFMDSMGDLQESTDMDSLTVNFNHAWDSASNLGTIANGYADALADDPKGFIIGMGKLAGEELGEEGKSLLASVMAKGFMKKNLKASANDDPDRFLRNCRVVNGMGGLDFNGTTLMPYGQTSEILLVVTYKVSVIQLLNIDMDFTFQQCAKTCAWGNGVSLIDEENNTVSQSASVWDLDNMSERGKKITASEKRKFTYTDSGHGYDAYVNSGGKNEFVKIVSADTHMGSNATEAGIKNTLSSAFSSLYGSVSDMEETITVTDKSGKPVTVSSPADTRSYQIVLVVPDDSDMEMIKRAKTEFEKNRAELGDKVTVEIRTGYGSPSSSDSEEEAVSS